MRRTSPKLLVTMAAVFTLALLAFVFAGGSRDDRAPRDRLSDEQAMAPSGRARQSPDTPAMLPGNEATPEATAPAPRPPPEPEIEPGSVAHPEPVVRPDPPAPPGRSASAPAKARADAQKAAEVRKAKPRAVPIAQRRTAPAQTANDPVPPRIASVRPSFNCRYARTRSEMAVCGDAGLARLDQQMAAQFNTAYRQGTAAQREVLERSRLRFLYRRDRCRSASCIAAVYQARMSEINDIAARNWREP